MWRDAVAKEGGRQSLAPSSPDRRGKTLNIGAEFWRGDFFWRLEKLGHGTAQRPA